MQYDDTTPEKLAKTIDKINKKFRSDYGYYVRKVKQDMHELADDQEPGLDTPLYRVIWYKGKSDTFTLTSKHDYKLHFVHGHNDHGWVDSKYKNLVTSLDNALGKSKETEGTYTVYCERKSNLTLKKKDIFTHPKRFASSVVEKVEQPSAELDNTDGDSYLLKIEPW